MDELFKTCKLCGFEWVSRNAFLMDPSIKIIGYQVNFDCLKEGLFLFEHVACQTTLSIGAVDFIDLYDGPMFQDRRTASKDCPGYCLRKNELRPCPAKCECAFVREALQIVKKWPKA